MAPDGHLAADLIALLDAAEVMYPYVSLDRLRRLARTEPQLAHLSSGLAALLRQATAEGIVLADNRLRLARGGELKPLRVYRLNRRHPAVGAALD